MNEKSSTFMALGTTLGMAIALIISLVLTFIVKENMEFIPFLFLGLALIFRCIGYGLDRIVDNGKKNK